MRLRDGAAHFFVGSLAAPVLSDDDAHHALRVLRLRGGEVVTACDGAGTWLPATLGRDGALSPVGEPVTEPAPRWRLGVAFAPVKAGKPEVIVQKLAELGVDDIVPLDATRRAVARWDGSRAGRQHERLAKVAREAAMQSRLARLPVVHPVTSLSDVLSRGAAVAEPGGEELEATDRLVAVGPEGGFDPSEVQAAPRMVSLGGTILRSETAAIVAGALMARARRTAP